MTLREMLKVRASYVKKHLKSYFGLSDAEYAQTFPQRINMWHKKARRRDKIIPPPKSLVESKSVAFTRYRAARLFQAFDHVRRGALALRRPRARL